jgi:hypothetical protein
MQRPEALWDRQGHEHEAKSRQPGEEAARCAAEIVDREREGEEQRAVVEGEQRAKEEQGAEEQQRGERRQVAAIRQRVRLELEKHQSRQRSRGRNGQIGKLQPRGQSRSRTG